MPVDQHARKKKNSPGKAPDHKEIIMKVAIYNVGRENSAQN